MATIEHSSIDAEIFSRLISRPGADDLTPEARNYFLSLEFPLADQDRQRELARKAQQGELTPEEEAEMDGFIRVGHFLSIIKSKARRSLNASAD